MMKEPENRVMSRSEVLRAFSTVASRESDPAIRAEAQAALMQAAEQGIDPEETATKDLDFWLGDIVVTDRAMCDEEVVGKWWPKTLPYAVETGDEGVVALFVSEKDAFRYRFDLINRKMNP